MRKVRAASIVLGAVALGAVALGAAALWQARAPAWPDAAARLVSPTVAPPAHFGKRRVLLDPGHGARDNTGNRSAFCRDEQDFTLSLAESVAAELERTGSFEVRLARRAGEVVEYADRIGQAEAWGADALVSLHSDVRGHARDWQPLPGRTCRRSRHAPGYAVIYSDDGEAALVERRRALARALGDRLRSSRFLPYPGSGYAGDYAPEPNAHGVFVDRRERNERIYLLHRPRLASVLIETHNALDDREALRWEEPETRRAFAAALAAALIDAFGAAPARSPSARL
jgi:N-acetylmuramoyl-L-alanine amidase